jgi:DNA end-binding protein Ku
MVRPFEGGLLLEQLRYAGELRSFSDVEIEEGEVSDSELDLAVQLVDQASSEAFEATDYKDDVRERMLELIQQKVDGEDIVTVSQEEPQTQIIDLMAALKASLSEEGSERKPAKAASGKKKAPARKRASS